MVSNAKGRLELVRDLIACNDKVHETAVQLAAYGWDYEGEGVALTRMHLVSILQRFIDGILSTEEVETWANFLEGRDDIEPDPDYTEEIEDLLYELANPGLTQPLSKARAKALIEKMSLH